MSNHVCDELIHDRNCGIPDLKSFTQFRGKKEKKEKKKNNSMIYGLPHSLQPTPKSWDRGLIFLEYCLPFPPRRDL